MGSNSMWSDSATPSSFLASTHISKVTKKTTTGMVQELLLSWGIQSGSAAVGLHKEKKH